MLEALTVVATLVILVALRPEEERGDAGRERRGGLRLRMAGWRPIRRR